MPLMPGVDLIRVTEITSSYFLSSVRVGAFLLSSPLFGARYVLLPVRILITMTLAIVIFSKIPEGSGIDVTSVDLPNLFVIILKEIAIGRINPHDLVFCCFSCR